MAPPCSPSNAKIVAHLTISALFCEPPPWTKPPSAPFCLSQADLANTLGVSRQTLNRQLKQFEAEGLISVGYAELTVRKPAALERLARAGDPLPV